jgi:molybdopterin/thiamine biosynthesis adenylyltransferase/ubiquitin-protein ligase
LIPWFERDPDRLRAEKETVQQLSESASWLKTTKWLIDGGAVTVEAVIEAHGHLYETLLFYPAYFPDAPISVRPKDSKEDWSGHQYKDGTLCLERGPDNWSPEASGAEMLESAYTLLYAENPRGDTHSIVLSRDSFTLGQYLRKVSNRLLVGIDLFSLCQACPPSTTVIFEGILIPNRDNCEVVICRITSFNGRPSLNLASPKVIAAHHHAKTIFGLLVRPLHPKHRIDAISKISQINSILADVGFRSEKFLECLNELSYGVRGNDGYVILVDTDNTAFLFRVARAENVVQKFMPVYLVESGTEKRLPAGIKNMREKKVAIVGLGSVGSKIALSLARTEVRQFNLVDPDVLLHENLCRHGLDARSVGQHKVDAVELAIKYLRKDTLIKVKKIDLTGQENASAVNDVLGEIGSCDMIIDATANPRANALLAAVAVTHGKPYVWMSVYAGGIGGMVARYRPGIDPEPYVMKARLDGCLRDLRIYSEVQTKAGYEAIDIEGEPIVATDAEVGIIANHATQMVIDLLLARQPSSFPYSMYLVGMKEGWVFKEPFFTIPIDVSGTSEML